MKFNFINYNFVIIILIFILLNNYPIRAEQISNEKIHKNLKETIPHWAINKDNTIKVMISCNFDKPCLSNIESFGGSVYEKFSDRIFFVNLPPASIEILANNPNIRYIRRALPEPIPALDTSKIKIGVSSLQNAPYQLTGSGIVSAIWEAREPITGGNLVDWNTQNDLVGRVTIRETSGSKSNHATHVAGILGGDGTNDQSLRGMATKVKLLSYNTSGFLSEYADMINRNGLVSQNSWVFDVNSSNCGDYGDYTDLESDLDNISRGDLSKAVTIVNSAGNERNDGDCNLPNNPYNSTPEPATAKNIITVGAIYSDSNDITCFSSFGPTDDGRIKPDVVAPGDEGSCLGAVSIRATIPNNAYEDKAGTSMAAPHVSGSAALMYQQFSCSKPYNIATPLPSTIKALLIHTTLDINSTGPDYASGWGLINATEAVDYILYRYFREANISSATDTDKFNFTINDSSKPVKVTLVWDDPADEDFTTPNLVNDLNLYLKAPNGTIFKSWTLDPNNPSTPATRDGNHRDNVEQVVVDSSIAGNWEIIVNATSCHECLQKYSLVYKRPWQMRLFAASPGSDGGWNEVSLPVVPHDPSVKNIFGGCPSDVSVVFVYNGTDWGSYRPCGGANTLRNVSANDVFWVNVTSTHSRETDGEPVTNTSTAFTSPVKFTPYLIYNSFFEIPVSEAVAGINISKLLVYKGGEGSSIKDKWDIYYANQTFEQANFNLVPGTFLRAYYNGSTAETWSIAQTRSCSSLNSQKVNAAASTMDEPFVLYGTATCGQTLNQSSQNVMIHIRVNDTEVSNYTMGDVGVNQYRLQVPVGVGVNVNDSAQIFINNISIGNNVSIGQAGELRYLNITANQTATIGTCLIPNITISSISPIVISPTERVFEVSILNNGQAALSNMSWSLNLGDGTVINSSLNMSLASSETVRLYLDYNYSSEGNYTVTANATAIVEGVTVTNTFSVGAAGTLSVSGLKILYSNLSEKIIEFAINNSGDANLSVNWTINFGDGNTASSTQNTNLNSSKSLLVYVQHSYASQGDYSVTATAQGGGSTASKSMAVEVEYLGVSNFSVLNSSGTLRTFGALVKNYMYVPMANVSWSLNTGNGVVSSTSPITLQPQESAFVFVTYNYTATGTFAANFTAVNSSWNDLEALNVTIT